MHIQHLIEEIEEDLSYDSLSLERSRGSFSLVPPAGSGKRKGLVRNAERTGQANSNSHRFDAELNVRDS